MSDTAYANDPTVSGTPNPFAPRTGLADGNRGYGVGGGGGVYGPTGNPTTDAWLADWHERNIGRQLEPDSKRLIDHIATVFSGHRVFDPLPNREQRQPWEHIDLENTTPSGLPPDRLMALKHGFDQSTLGALRKWSAIDGPLTMASDPNFDVFTSPAILRSPYKDQMHLFMGAHSEREVEWRILQMNTREREGRLLERMGGGGVFEFAGGFLGDPLNALPATLGFKGAQLAMRVKALNAPEKVLVGFKPVVWGGIGDGLRAGALQSAIALADAGLHSALDPSHTNGSIGDIVATPGAIAASIGMLVGAGGRFQIGMEALSRQVGNHNFLAATRPKARVMEGGQEGPMAPGVMTNAERNYWNQHVKDNEYGRVHVDGRVQTVVGDDVYFRTAEGLDVVIPLRDVDIASTTGARGITLRSGALTGNDALMASAMRLDGPFVGGGRPKLYEHGHDVVSPGALHTDYAAMRTEEMIRNGTFSALRPIEHPDFTAFQKGNKVVGPNGEVITVYHGTRRYFEEHSNEMRGAYTGAASAREGHFFAGKPDTSQAYSGHLETINEITTRSWLDRILGRPGKVTNDARNEAGTPQIRPTYLRMTNPKELHDAPLVGPEAFADKIGKTIGDGRGGLWLVHADKFERVERTIDPSWDGRPGFVPSIERATGEFDTKIVPVTHGRNVNYLDEIKQAKDEGHDGVIFRNTKDGGTADDVYVVFDPKTQIRGFDQRYQLVGGDVPEPRIPPADRVNLGGVAEATADVDIAKGSLSAANIPGAASGSRRTQLEMNRMVATGIGIERLPFDIMSRAAMLPFTTWQTTIGDMVAPGGRLLMKNTAAFGYRANALSAETLIQTEWKKPLTDTLRMFRDDWREYREGAGPTAPSDSGRIGYEPLRMGKDLFSNAPNRMSFAQFLDRVGDAQFNNDIDLITDAATPHINNSAAKARQIYRRTAREGTAVGVFQEAHEEQIRKFEGRLQFLKDSNAPALKIQVAEAQLRVVQGMLHDILTRGAPHVSTAASYRPRVWLKDQLRERALEFKQIVDDWMRTTANGRSLTPAERAEAVDEIHQTLLRDKPYYLKEDVDKLFNDLADPSTAMARTFQIPDMLVKDFLESNAEVLLRNHVRHMGTAIEMHRKFGSTGMEEQIADLAKERDLLVAAAPTNDMKREIVRKHDLALKDLEATRDRMYGVYGAPDDPHRWQSRTIRMAKQFTNLTVLGMSGVTAMGDLVRPLMTEGLQAVYEYGFKSLASDVRRVVFDMNRGQLERAGAGGELINNTRALAFSDAGDIGNSRSGFERAMAQANSWGFVLNGLNHITQASREWAGVIIQGNMNQYLMALERGERINPKLQARLANSGVEFDMAKRMGEELRLGNNDFGKLTLADTDAWTDRLAAQHYDAMFNQLIHRVVPTPGFADTPNWMSTEMGSLIGMYKGFMFGAMNRTMVSGLQEEGQMFWFKAASAVGFAIILNEIRSRLFYDRSTMDKPMTAIIMDGVDRSSILGYFSDANKAIEVLTGHRTGLRPLLHAERPRTDSTSRILGTIGGPAVGQGANALSVFGDILSMHPTARTMADARRLIPLNNVPYLDPVFDRLVSDGNPYPRREPKGRRVNRPVEAATVGP